MVTSRQAGVPRLLYVEDELDAAEIVLEVIGEHYEIDHAASGEQGLSLALHHRYDVMVFDRRLPGLSGTELVQRVRTAHIDTPILMLTALGSVDDRVMDLDIGADDVEAEVARLEKLGAKRIKKVNRWIVMQAPTGQRFCVVPAESEAFLSQCHVWK